MRFWHDAQCCRDDSADLSWLPPSWTVKKEHWQCLCTLYTLFTLSLYAIWNEPNLPILTK